LAWSGLKVGGRLALVLHSSDELGELSQWQCHHDSSIDVVVHSSQLNLASILQTNSQRCVQLDTVTEY